MRRLVVLWLAVLFITGFAVVTVLSLSEEGFNVLSVVSLFVVVVLTVGIVGALLHPPK